MHMFFLFSVGFVSQMNEKQQNFIKLFMHAFAKQGLETFYKLKMLLPRLKVNFLIYKVQPLTKIVLNTPQTLENVLYCSDSLGHE